MSNRSHITVLMTGAGAPGAPGILRCLQQDERFRVIGCDADPEATGRFLGMPFYQVPKAISPDFIPSILRICEQEQVDILLPLVTRELVPLSEATKKFEAVGTKVLVNTPQVLEIANNKGLLYQRLQAENIAVPRFHIAEDIQSFDQAVSTLGYPGCRLYSSPVYPMAVAVSVLSTRPLTKQIYCLIKSPTAPISPWKMPGVSLPYNLYHLCW